MKKLVIAEKPSVGVTLANVLGSRGRNDGYIEGAEYIISWCFGHIAELASPESYDERYAKWKYDDLPIIPSTWKYKVFEDKRQQFEILRQLMHRHDVDTVINACDAGREGELIFRNVYNLSGCTKPIKRLWISSMEDSAIKKGFENLEDGSKYDNLYAAARCRECADWLVGINATRLFSILYHRTLNVGRVVSPTLALIVERSAEIDAFKPEPFYTIELDFGSFTATSGRYKDKNDARNLMNHMGDVALVNTVSVKEKTENPPLLYDLTTLQRDANRIHGYTAQQTLDYVQSLYEKKLCTYPRTDSRYRSDDMSEVIGTVAMCAAGICKADVPSDISHNRICRSEKVSDHHAIIPTEAAGSFNIPELPVGEREILNLISKQVLRAVSEPYRYNETVVEIICGGATYTAKGKVVTNLGWRAYDGKDERLDNAAIIPNFAECAEIDVVNRSIKEGTTTPPSQFTEDSLLSAMESAGAKDIPEDAERRGLGTPATRAGIIEKLISTGFVERKKSKKSANLIPAHTGISLITVLPEQLQSPLLTAEWESKLKAVERGEMSEDTFMSEIALMVNELTRTYSVIKGAEVLFPSGRDVIGKCPRCGGDVTESKQGYFCERNECRFGLWRDNKFLADKRITLTKTMVTALLRDGCVPVKGIFSEKTGRSYDAHLILIDDGEKSKYSLDFGRADR